MADEKHNLITWLGFTTEPDFSKARLLGHAIGYGFVALYVCVFALLVGGLMWTITHVPDIIDDVIYATDPTEARWLLASLAALTAVTSAAVALPFTVLKTIYNRRQTEVEEQTHITDQIYKAVESLGTTRQVDGNAEPNPEIRIGGLLALERLGRQNPSEHIQTMEIICSYICENCRMLVAEKFKTEEDGTPISGTNTILRDDIAIAFRIIGRRSNFLRSIEEKRTPSFQLNFAGADFRGLVLDETDFSNAELAGAKLQYAKLNGARFVNAIIKDTNLNMAQLTGANMQSAEIIRCSAIHTKFSFANFRGGILYDTDIFGADCFGTDFRGAQLVGLTDAGEFSSQESLEDKLFALKHDPPRLDGAVLSGMVLSDHSWLLTKIESVFGNHDVELPPTQDWGGGKTVKRPAHWLTYARYAFDPNFEQKWHAWQDEIGFDRRTNTLKGHSD